MCNEQHNDICLTVSLLLAGIVSNSTQLIAVLVIGSVRVWIRKANTNQNIYVIWLLIRQSDSSEISVGA